MLAQAVALHDPTRCTDERCIHDLEAFVQATINRSRILLTQDERDDLVADGFAIVYKLAGDYQPHINGHQSGGWLSGYVAMYLPRKLGDAWHRRHPEHMLVTQPDGRRRWEYKEKAVSLEALTADDPDRHEILTAQVDETDVRSQVRRTLDEQWARRREMICNVAEYLSTGATWTDAAQDLGLTAAQVRYAVDEISTAYGIQAAA